MSTNRPSDPAAQALLGWMQQHPAELRDLLDDEARDGDDLSPAGEPAIRAHLRFVALALAATAGPATRDGFSELARTLGDRFDADRDALDADFDELGEAAAHELDLQFGAQYTEGDPVVREMIARRLRVQALSRYFVRQVAAACDDEALAPAVFAWMGDHQTDLANTIFSMDRRAKEAEIARRGPEAVDDAALVNQIGQAAMLQAHVRFLVEGLATMLVARQAT